MVFMGGFLGIKSRIKESGKKRWGGEGPGE